MDISYQLFEIGILLANNGFIPILKKLTMPALLGNSDRVAYTCG
jgi:hypothetical protein